VQPWRRLEMAKGEVQSRIGRKHLKKMEEARMARPSAWLRAGEECRDAMLHDAGGKKESSD
jgi:hypothetical protein